MTIRESNFAIAKRMGWVLENCNAGGECWANVELGKTCRANPSDYCDDFVEAVRILDKWRGDWNLRRQNKQFKCTLYRPSEEFEDWDSSPSRAICRAFLKVP